MTKTFGTLQAQLVLKVLGKSTWFVGVRVIRGDEGVGDISGVQGGSGGLKVLHNMNSIDTRTQT